MKKPDWKWASSKETTPLPTPEYRTTYTEKLVDDYLRSTGQEPHEVFPLGCEFRIIAKKVDSHRKYWEGISKLRDLVALKRITGEKLFDAHNATEDLAWSLYQESREEMSRILEEKGIKNDFQQYLENQF